MRIRKITEVDLPNVRDLDALAWAGLFPPFRKRTKRYRTLNNLTTNWLDDPEGCFVAEQKSNLLGYIFCHIHGSLGWIGVFGVDPEHRGEGIGKKLLETSIKHLESKGCSTIGLETRPDAYNVGLYLSHGFKLEYLTLITELTVSDRSPQGEFVEWSNLGESDRENMDRKFLATCHAVQAGLDYATMGELRVLNGQAKVCSFGDKNDPAGFAVIRTAPRFLREKFSDAFVEAMVIRPGSERKFPEMIRTLKGLTSRWRKRNLVVPVKSSDWGTIETLLSNGFRIRRSLLRMMYKEKIASRGVNLNFWGM